MLGDMNVTLSAKSKRRVLTQALALSLGLTGASIAWMVDPPANAPMGAGGAADSDLMATGSCAEATRGVALAIGAQRRARVERQCLDAGGGAACDATRALEPREAVCLAERVALGEGNADRLGLMYRAEHDSLVWRVVDDAEGTAVELDAETGDMLRWSR